MTRDVQLRPVLVDDLPILFRHQADRVAAEMAVFTSRTWEAFDRHWRDNILAVESALKRTVLVDGAVAGNVTSYSHDGRRLVSYWIDRALWGRGIATEAVRAFLEIETERPLYAFVAKSNVGSMRVLEKNGFAVILEETVQEPNRPAIVELLLQLR